MARGVVLFNFIGLYWLLFYRLTPAGKSKGAENTPNTTSAQDSVNPRGVTHPTCDISGLRSERLGDQARRESIHKSEAEYPMSFGSVGNSSGTNTKEEGHPDGRARTFTAVETFPRLK